MTTATQQTGLSVTHGTFTLERTFRKSPPQVFEAWANRESKNHWFGEGDDFLETLDTYELDFRVGGREYLDGKLPSGKRFEYDSTYGDIVDGRRIIATYDVRIDGRRISVSLLTVELEDAPDGGTHLVMTEQGAFLDGLDTNEQRIIGARESLDNMEKYLA